MGKKEEEKEKLKENRGIVGKPLAEDKVGERPSLYCFSLMMPYGYEPALLQAQQRKGVGIFACDESEVLSNTTMGLGFETVLLPGSLSVKYGGKWGTALNTNIFNRVWTEILRRGRYRFHDWAVKVDPDAVFFPDRLQNLLRRHTPESKVPLGGAEEPKEVHCGQCALSGHEHQTCALRVKEFQKQGRTCGKALELAARTPPEDCGCVCSDLACDRAPEAAMYLNNCKWGLHGPIEVLSRRAVAIYVTGLPQCAELMDQPWGEDKYLDHCMQSLGVMRVSEFHLLSETACGETPAPCGGSDVAFHPFKSIQTYFDCWGYGTKFGHGPADEPWSDEADNDEANDKANDDQTETPSHSEDNDEASDEADSSSHND